MAIQNLLLETSNGVAPLLVNRSDKLNAPNTATIDESHDCFDSLRDDARQGCAAFLEQRKPSFHDR